MGFESKIPLEDHIDERAAGRCARGIADAAGDRLQADTRRLTPVGSALDPNRSADRPPGTLRESVQRSEVEDFIGPSGRGYRVRVFTSDPIAPDVEYSTRPHEIRPRADRAPASVLATGRPRGTVQDGRAALSWVGPGGRRFARVVHHPGTQGQHMFSRGALELIGHLRDVAHDPLKTFERDLIRRVA